MIALSATVRALPLTVGVIVSAIGGGLSALGVLPDAGPIPTPPHAVRRATLWVGRSCIRHAPFGVHGARCLRRFAGCVRRAARSSVARLGASAGCAYGALILD